MRQFVFEMKTSPARLLILTCGLFLALFDIVAVLPGNPAVTSVGSFLFVIAVQALIVWRLLHRSRMAWLFTVIVSSAYTLSSILVGVPWETTLVLSAFLASTQVALLCTPPVLAYVIRGDDTVA
jgi:hypothetical protein